MTERRGFSTALSTSAVEDLDGRRRARACRVFATCQDLASKTQATFHAGAKVFRAREDEGPLQVQGLYGSRTTVTDVVRCTLSYSSRNYSTTAEKVLDLFGDDVKEAHDRYQQPLGDYRDRQLVRRDNHVNYN